MSSAGMNALAVVRLRSSLAGRIDAGLVPGAVLVVERHGVPVIFEALGEQDPLRGTPMRIDSIFRIYSMTKPIVSVALMQMVEQGRVSLRDPVARYLPEFADVRVGSRRTKPKRVMTVHDLLRHTAGMTYEFQEPSLVQRRYVAADLYARHRSSAVQIAVLAELPLMHEPGSIWNYSRATDVLGRLVEVLADRSLGEQLQNAIFEPLGMVDTGFSVPASEHHRLAESFINPPKGLADAPLFDPRIASPLQSGGGGLLSTAHDYTRFMRMLLAGGRVEGARLLGRKTVEAMTADHLGPIPHANAILPPGHGFGLGFAVKTALGEHTEPGSVGSYGWSGKAGTTFFIDPQEQLLAMILTQTPYFLDEVRELFRQMVYAAID